jgi:DnaJ homolog subfamily C member 28
MQKYAKARRNIEMDPDEDVKVFDIKHTAPQHRTFLNFEGYGMGTPFQREKQYQQIRAMKAQQNVLEHRLQKAYASENALIKKGDHFKKHAIKTKYGFDRVVEDLIQEAMQRGDFNNLKGTGKPLENQHNQNPYVDFVTHKINNILLENNFTPEFISLHKEIREDIDNLKMKLRKDRAKLKYPAQDEDLRAWENVIEKYAENVRAINKNIDKYNLIVPILNKQMVQIELKRIANKIIAEKPEEYQEEADLNLRINSEQNINLFSLLSSLWK